MTENFPYLKREDKYYPIVPVLLSFRNEVIFTEALIDSGANTSVFHGEVAEQLGIDIKQGKKIYLGGIGGRILAYMHQVNIRVRNSSFNCRVSFTNEMPVSLNILGRDNFFKQFIVIFDESKQQITLESKQ